MKNKKIGLVLISLLISSLFLHEKIFAQPSIRTCEFELQLKKEMVQNPLLRNEIEESENKLKDYINNSKLRFQNSAAITLPLIVHVLYHSPVENIPDTQVMKMVQVLNEDLGRYNHDTANTPAAFLPFAASTGIQFCMATHDSAGNYSNGIEHVFTNTSQFNNPYQMSNPTFGGTSPWNTDMYFNIWIGNAAAWGSNFSLGYYPYPTFHLYWGLLADYNHVSQIVLGDTTFVSGRTITHALGHCFNLLHPFSNTGCFDDDSVSDTPIESQAVFGCPIFPVMDSCTVDSPGIMYMNYMNIADERCVNMFTKGQATRMVNSLNLFFPLLVNSSGCLPLGINDMDWDDKLICSPNPTKGNLHLIFKRQNILIVKVYNLLGELKKTEYRFENSPGTVELYTDALSPGLYYLQIVSETGIITKRFIKQ